MMMRFVPGDGKVSETLVKLRRNSIRLEPAELEDLTLTASCVRVVRFEVAESGKQIETNVRLSFEKNRAGLVLSVNPELLAILGYAPGVPTVVTEDTWPAEGAVLSVPLSDKLTPAQTKAVEDLDYLLNLHVVLVGLP